MKHSLMLKSNLYLLIISKDPFDLKKNKNEKARFAVK